MTKGRLPQEIAQMLQSRRLEQVTANKDHARSVIMMSQQHIQTAITLSKTTDHAMAFTSAYDAARKALAAVLSAEGLRVRPIGGAHHNTGIAAAAFVGQDALTDFEWMRQIRNSTEYPSSTRPSATQQDVFEAIEAATSIVNTCADYLSLKK
ncbi:MAG: HEPN domain-containing protein [Actinomycetaceae bacterium]|nr:HEPN domain-containing protein [Actinomycetaceae bacterium]